MRRAILREGRCGTLAQCDDAGGEEGGYGSDLQTARLSDRRVTEVSMAHRHTSAGDTGRQRCR